MFGSLYFILIKYQLAVKLAMLELMCACVRESVCVRECVCVCAIYILGVARYTDVTVRYVPRFGGHGSIRFRYNMKKKEIYYARFLFIYFEQTVTLVQIKKNPSRCENTTYNYMLYI